MRDRAIIEPTAFLGGLDTFFDRTCTINEATKVKQGGGVRTETWTALAAHTDLHCRIAPVTARSRPVRVEWPDMTVTTVSHIIVLPGAYPLVTTAHQAVLDDGTTYQIVHVLRDSEQVATELEVEAIA